MQVLSLCLSPDSPYVVLPEHRQTGGELIGMDGHIYCSLWYGHVLAMLAWLGISLHPPYCVVVTVDGMLAGVPGGRLQPQVAMPQKTVSCSTVR